MVAKLLERGDDLSVWAANMIQILQDACYEQGQEIRRLKGD